MQKEQGICLRCGKETAGTAAKADWIILGARKIRACLSKPGHHTVACSNCLPKLLEKRKRFEKNRFWYYAAGVLFFVLAAGLAASRSSLGVKEFFGAAAGAIVIAGLSLFYYSPDFSEAK